MKLNAKKTKIMIINFTRNYQFSTRIQLLELVEETIFLGCVITPDLKFHKKNSVYGEKGL